jgi:hypothetical protein
VDTGRFTYSPAGGFTGSDSFRFRASDGTLLSAAEVTVTVEAPARVAPVLGQRTSVTPGAPSDARAATEVLLLTPAQPRSSLTMPPGPIATSAVVTPLRPVAATLAGAVGQTGTPSVVGPAGEGEGPTGGPSLLSGRGAPPARPSGLSEPGRLTAVAAEGVAGTQAAPGTEAVPADADPKPSLRLHLERLRGREDHGPGPVQEARLALRDRLLARLSEGPGPGSGEEWLAGEAGPGPAAMAPRGQTGWVRDLVVDYRGLDPEPEVVPAIRIDLAGGGEDRSRAA